MAINGMGSIDQCLTILQEMGDAVYNARKAYVDGAFMGGDGCVVNRSYLLKRIDELHNTLPDVVHQAETMLREESQIRAQTDQECNDRINKAQSQAQQLVADAQQHLTQAQLEASQASGQAEKIIQDAQRRAQEEAARILQQAHADAEAMLAEADAKCRELVAAENVYRMAAVAADEMRESNQDEILRIRQNTFEYLDQLLDEADGFLGKKLMEVRMERGEFSKRRDGRNW